VRVIASLMVLGAFLLVPAAASAQAQDSIVGEGTARATNFTISVHAGPNGESPSGLLSMTGFVTGNAVPTCPSVVGNVAVGAYTLVDGPVSGRGFIAEVQDNGPPINGQPVDVVTYAGFIIPGPGPATCPLPGAGPPPGFSDVGDGPFLSGDVTVTDAPQLPTSKDQCKNGGWKAYGVFKNQGDCVSFVATDGKNAATPQAG
jgi:hypothetical protein